MKADARFLVPIFRPSKLEAVRAMNALVERGFNIETPLTEVKSTLEYRGNYNYRRGKYGSKGIGVVTGWYCRLEGDRRNG